LFYPYPWLANEQKIKIYFKQKEKINTIDMKVIFDYANEHYVSQGKSLQAKFPTFGLKNTCISMFALLVLLVIITEKKIICII